MYILLKKQLTFMTGFVVQGQILWDNINIIVYEQKHT